MADKILIVELSSYGVKFTQFDGETISLSNHQEFKGSSEIDYKEQLTAYILQQKIDFSTQDEVLVSWSSKETSLVPAGIFAESNAEAIYKLCFHVDIPQQQVDYNRIPELQLVNVFDIPLWVKSFFVLKFPRVIIQHEGTHLLRSIFKGSTFKTSCSILLHKEYFSLTIVKANNLQFYSTFEYQTADDVIYYLSYTLQQKEMADSLSEIRLMNGVLTEFNINQQIKVLLEKLPIYKNCKLLMDDALPAKYLKTCV